MTPDDPDLLHFTVDVWHPGCWTLETTRDADAGLLGHGTSVTGSSAVGWYTAYADATDPVEALVESVREARSVERVTRLASVPGAAAARGSATRDLVVTFDPGPTIRPAFTARGFIHYGPTRHEGGRERRSFLAAVDREAVERSIADIEAEHDATVDLVRIGGMAAPRRERDGADGRLTPRQREAFELARERGYYDYPRGTDARALAADLDVSKTTFLEHLRKAEAKLLSDVSLP